MIGLNRVTLVGNVATEPRLSPSGTLRFRVAVNSRGRRDCTDYFTVVMLNKHRAEAIAPRLCRGAVIGIDGALRNSTVEHAGERRDVVEIIAFEVALLERRAVEGEASRAPVSSGAAE